MKPFLFYFFPQRIQLLTTPSDDLPKTKREQERLLAIFAPETDATVSKTGYTPVSEKDSTVWKWWWYCICIYVGEECGFCSNFNYSITEVTAGRDATICHIIYCIWRRTQERTVSCAKADAVRCFQGYLLDSKGLKYNIHLILWGKKGKQKSAFNSTSKYEKPRSRCSYMRPSAFCT